MTSRPTETTDLDLAAAWMAVAGKQPSVFQPKGKRLAICELPDDEATREIIVAYATGTLCLNVKTFAACRSWLYRKVREVCQGGKHE